MSDDSITKETWEEYLDDLYSWIQEKYTLFEETKIGEDEYNEHLDYYMKEKERIENIIENLEEVTPSEPNAENSSFLTKETFEEFFGVKIDDELKKIDQEDSMSIMDNKSEDRPETTDVWSYVTDGMEEEFAPRLSDQEIDPRTTDKMKINILLIGDSAVGRTSIRRAWMGKHFIENHLTTIGASIEKKTITLDGIVYDITLTDLGGQDFYSGLRRNFYRNIDAAIIVFDLTRPETFRKLDFWVKEMYREIKRLVPFMIVGNKKDSDSRQIPEKYGIRASAKYSRTTLPRFRVRYMETSAKSGENVNEMFNIMCREIRDLKIQKQDN